MLNLVQLQDRLRDVPMQALMQYANGANPQVPPFLALTELNRRKKMQEGAAAEQAKEMEGAPTIKEQIEQAAGLLALQGNRQQQASRQQAGIQAAMPMAAPNTTTSEPAQMAAGGAIDDIVVPRDFQMGGGVMNPEMMKRMMMMRKMKPRVPPGLAGIPLPKDMFKRSDYAGGGIVAFQGGGSTFGGFSEDDEERKSSTTIPEMLRVAAEAIKKGIAGGGDPEFYSRDIDADKEKQARTRVRGRSDAQQSMIEDARDRAMSQIMSGPRVTRLDEPAAPSARPPGIASLPGVPEAVSRYLGIDPKTAIPDIPETTAKMFKENLREANKQFGVSEDPFKERKRRYGEVEAEDKRRRAEQPMDQLGAFLSGIAEARGGNVFTQGAKGARASRELRAQQAELNRKQDLDMAALMGAIEDKEDAIVRGDRDKFLASQQAEKEARRNLSKDRVALANNQAQIANQSLQARSSMMSALKPSTFAEQLALFRSNPKEFEKLMQARGMSDETLALRSQQNVDKLLKEDPRYFEYRLLAMDPDPKKQKQAAEIRARAYAEAGVPLPGSAPGVVVTREK